MALPDFHVVQGFAPADASGSGAAQGLFGDGQWEATPSAGTATTNKATDMSGLRPVFRCTINRDVTVRIGPAAAVQTKPRIPLMLDDGRCHDLYARPGDVILWEAFE